MQKDMHYDSDRSRLLQGNCRFGQNLIGKSRLDLYLLEQSACNHGAKPRTQGQEYGLRQTTRTRDPGFFRFAWTGLSPQVRGCTILFGSIFVGSDLWKHPHGMMARSPQQRQSSVALGSRLWKGINSKALDMPSTTPSHLVAEFPGQARLTL